MFATAVMNHTLAPDVFLPDVSAQTLAPLRPLVIAVLHTAMPLCGHVNAGADGTAMAARDPWASGHS